MMTNIYKTILARLTSGQASLLTSRYSLQGVERSLTEPDPGTPGGLAFTAEGDSLTLTECFRPRPRLVILGGGHIALPLCRFGAMLGWEVWVYDDRPSFANPGRFPDASRVICDEFINMSDRLRLRGGDYVTILTRGHRHDIFCLQGILDTSGPVPHYVGMIGSKRRVAIVKEEVAKITGRGDLLDNLHAPIGLPIGSVTPTEIALSIMAEMVQVKRNAYPQDGGTDLDLLRRLAEPEAGIVSLVTIVSTQGSTPREAGAKMAITATGEVVGSIGGGCAEADVIRRARELSDQGGYGALEVDLTDSAEADGMVCGGRMVVLIETVL